MTLDPNTQKLLDHQAARLSAALAEIPPNHTLAAEIQMTVDNILDSRKRPVAVASDGEVIYPGVSSWVASQGEPNAPVDVVDVERAARLARRRLGIAGDGDDDGGLVGAKR